MIKKILIFLLAFSIAAAVGTAAYMYIPRFAGTIYNDYISPLMKFHAGILNFSFGSEDNDGKTEDAAALGGDAEGGGDSGGTETGGDRGEPKYQEDGELNVSGGLYDNGNNSGNFTGENNPDNTGSENPIEYEEGSGSSGSVGHVGGDSNNDVGHEGNSKGSNADSPAFYEISEAAEEELRDKIVEEVVAFISKGGTAPEASMLDKLTFEEKLNIIRLLQSIGQSDREEISRLVKSGDTEEASKRIKDILKRNLDFAALKSLYSLIISNEYKD